MTIESFLINTKTLSITQIEKLKEEANACIIANEHMLMGIIEYYIKDEEYELLKINKLKNGIMLKN